MDEVVFTVIGWTSIILASLVLLSSLGVFNWQIKIHSLVFRILLFLVIVSYLIFIAIETVEGKTGIEVIVALLSKLGELLIIPVAIGAFQAENSKTKTSKSKTKTVTTETVKIDFNDVEHYEKTTTVTEEE